MNKELNYKTASELASKILVGAYLDRITAHSIQISLGFLADEQTAANSKEIVVAFTCNARIEHLSQTNLPAESREFFTERASFFAQAHGLIGKTVSSVEAQADGALRISIGNMSVHLWLSTEDIAADDWVWKVAVEEDSEAYGIYCCPVGEGIIFTTSGRQN